jgi:Putative zinc-finger
MMHPQIDDEEIIERYARNQLGPEEKRAFEEHFFSCDACFEKVSATERFIAGIRDAAQRGLLTEQAQGEAGTGWQLNSWWIPAFAAAVLVLALVAGWQYFVQIPRMRGQLSQTAAELSAEQHARATLEQQLQQGIRAEVNVPLVMLQATRDVQAAPTEAILPTGAAQLVLWIDVASGKYRSYRLDIYDAVGKSVETLQPLSPNSYGALAASLPAQRLQAGELQIKLFGDEPPPRSLLAEYRLSIRRP